MTDHQPTGQWTKARNVIITSVVLSWGLTIGTLAVLQRSPMPWTIRYLQADTIAIGGGNGQGAITLSAMSQLDGASMVVLKGASSNESLTLSTDSKGRPMVRFDGASGKPGMVLELDASGRPAIRMMSGATGQAAWTVTLDENGQPVVWPR
ncbi:MAG: hypothetical protein K2X32_12660 [Phycisphaerales bacterium]|nr:hypothetical protein [Phycisphaerales bacterium]